MPVRHVYVHVPFCARRCVYCDFSIAVRRTVPVEAFIRAVARELELRQLSAAPLETLYLGGGTPSQLGGDGVSQLVERLLSRFPLAPGAEVTMEANPEDVTREAAAAWSRAGVNRVSLGVQSFEPAVLGWMHRGHDAARVAAAVSDLRHAGIVNLSLDLIYGVPAELERDWFRDMDLALALEPQHLSCYGLTVEPMTVLGKQVARGVTEPAPDESHEVEFLEAHRRLSAAGFDHYEVSNYALPGQRSRHNSAYWTSAEYHGVGPSAHGFDGIRRRWNIPALSAWEAAIALGNDPLGGEETLGGEQRSLEQLYFDLRTERGSLIHGSDAPILERWAEEGWARTEGKRLRLTPLGWLRLDALVSALTQHRSRY